MTQEVSQRAIVGSIVVAACGLATNPAIAAMPGPETQITVKGTVAWCHPQRGLLMFHTEPRGRDGMLIHLKTAASGPNVRLLRPGTPVNVALIWRPDLEFISPWTPVHVIGPDGAHFAAEAPEDVLAKSRSGWA
jgi:hypothetical protein